MLPPVKSLLQASAAVTAIIANPPRVYPHGDAPQKATAPYMTWFIPVSTPDNVLDDISPVDNVQVQLDGWSDNDGTGATGIVTLTEAARAAIEPHAYLVSGPSYTKDERTQRYRSTMTFSFWIR